MSEFTEAQEAYLKSLSGQKLSQELLNQLNIRFLDVRVVYPMQMLTNDYHESRLNVNLDAHGVIQSTHFG